MKSSEKRRLSTLGGPSLYPGFRERILAYYREHGIAWWGGGEEPTENPISSQVACINHLEPARLDRELALHIARRHLPDAVDVLPIEDGFLAYEWIGVRSYLNERGWSSSSRGRNVTSIDAVMAVRRDNGIICLFVIEWKYTESYRPGRSLAVSDRGTSRIEIYRPLLEHADSPIRLGEHERLFFDPFDQLMRQTLLAWQMVEHGEFGATEWLHIHVAPSANVALLGTVTSPQLAEFGNMASAWRSVLVVPERYALVTPGTLTPDVASGSEFRAWREWLRVRYAT
ncbi:MAG TPA: hypothetical protein VLY22_00300 [Candidatus Nitrosotalea sp.]|nr:hypothetical protein [Candidatus Nitrosotalea sp.]